MREAASIPLHPDWDKLETDKLSHDGMGYTYEFTLAYKVLPDSYEVEDDTKTIARAILKRVTRMQKASDGQSIWISVCAKQDGLYGETGKPLVRPLGCSRYESQSDRISFNPDENTPPSWFH